MSLPKALPKDLTVTDWTAKKKLPTKISGGTGIGAGLTRLKQEWDKVDWEALDPNTAVTRLSGNSAAVLTEALLDQAAPAAAAAKSKVPAVRTQLTKVLALIKTTETKWKGNKLIPSASVKHMTAMRMAAQTLDDDLETIGEAMDKAWAAARDMAGYQAKLKSQSTLTKLRGHASKVRAKAPKVLQAEDPVKEYTAFHYPSKAKGSTDTASPSLHQLINELNAELQRTTQPQWTAARQTFAAMADNSFLPTTEAQASQRVNQVLQAVAALEQTF